MKLKLPANTKVSVSFGNSELKNRLDELRSGKFEDQELYQRIWKVIDDLKKDPYCGEPVSKKRFPKKYVDEFQIRNLFIKRIDKNWRLLYTIQNISLVVMALILDWERHKDYERRFGYKRT